MSLLPQSRFTIRSSVSPEEALSRLDEATGRSSWSSRGDGKPYTGDVANGAFRIMRVSRGRNSFRPLIQGTIASSTDGSEVTVTTRIHTATLVFVGIMIAVLSMVGLPVLATGLTSGRLDLGVLVIPGMIAFLVVMMRFAFAVESRRAQRELAVILAGDVHEG